MFARLLAVAKYSSKGVHNFPRGDCCISYRMADLRFHAREFGPLQAHARLLVPVRHKLGFPALHDRQRLSGCALRHLQLPKRYDISRWSFCWNQFLWQLEVNLKTDCSVIDFIQITMGLFSANIGQDELRHLMLRCTHLLNNFMDNGEVSKTSAYGCTAASSVVLCSSYFLQLARSTALASNFWGSIRGNGTIFRHSMAVYMYCNYSWS